MVQTQEVINRGKFGYLPKWVHILNAPLSEGSIPTYLGALDISLDHRHIPTPMIVQVLLYFTLFPPKLPADCLTPLQILEKIVSYHQADLHRLRCLPIYPRGRDAPRWLGWEANSPTERTIKWNISRATEEGIWGLLWERGDTQKVPGTEKEPESGRSSKRLKMQVDKGDDDDEEEGGKVEKKVSQQGWKLLEWLVNYWEEDQKQSGLGYSPAFLAQMPKQKDMQYDNPSLPLAVIRSGLSHLDTSPGPNRAGTICKIMELLISTAIPPSPPFHPATLVLSLLPLLRTPLPDLDNVLHLFKAVPRGVYAHILIHAIEDLAGIRASKALERRRRPNQSHAGTISDFEVGGGNFPAPTIGYTKKALLYTSRSSGGTESGSGSGSASGSGNGTGMGTTGSEITVLKMALVECMIHLHPQVSEWDFAKRDGGWRTEFERLPFGNWESERMVRDCILIILNSLYRNPTPPAVGPAKKDNGRSCTTV